MDLYTFVRFQRKQWKLSDGRRHLDGNGNLYGTTPVPGNGTVWEITP